MSQVVVRPPFVPLSTVWTAVLRGERRTETWQFSTVNDFSIQIVTIARHDWTKPGKLGERLRAPNSERIQAKAHRVLHSRGRRPGTPSHSILILS